MLIRVVRHGESEGNRASTLQGCRVDAPLSAKGQKQAEALAIRLAGENIDYVLASPMKRALHTARIIEAPHGLGVDVDPLLVEFNWGDWTGQPLDDEMERRVSNLRERWRAGDTNVAPPGGETPQIAAKRVEETLGKLIESGTKAPLVVAHGRFNRILITLLLGRELSCMDEVRQRNGSLSVLEWDGSGPASLVMVDDISHFDDALARPAGRIDSLLR